MKFVLIVLLLLAVLVLVAWFAYMMLERSKPLPRSRQLEEARRVMLDIQHTDDIFASLPTRTRANLDKILKDTEE